MADEMKRARGEFDSQGLLERCCDKDTPIVKSLLEQNAALKAEIAALEANLPGGKLPAAVSESDVPSILPRTTSSILPNGVEVAIAPEELAAMYAIFELFDEDRDGRISKTDLRALHAKLGEPITEAEACDAVKDLAASDGEYITFEEFAAYWDGTHPSLRHVAASASSSSSSSAAPDAEAAAAAAELSQKRRWYQARFKFMKAKIGNPAVGRVYSVPRGPCPSLEYRVHFYVDEAQAAGSAVERVEVSPWHDVPLCNPDGTWNMVVEIPKWSRRKFELATGEPFNPIKQDVKNGLLREYGYGDMLFNYGCMPQTWEDPAHKHPDTGVGGDNDPIDVIDVGSKMWTVGSIVRVKVLGVLGLIDSGETDWKIIALSAEDPLAEHVSDLADLEVHMPGAVEALHRWLKLYKTPTINEFAFNGEARDRAYAERVIMECHEQWRHLVDDAKHPHAEGSAAAAAPAEKPIKADGLRRSSSSAKLGSSGIGQAGGFSARVSTLLASRTSGAASTSPAGGAGGAGAGAGAEEAVSF